MNLAAIEICSFGCLRQKEFSLESGLNVVLGPNEAGKSTLFDAVEKALYMPSKLKKNKFDSEIAPHLPLAGGDTIDVKLSFSRNGEPERYALHRSWGRNKVDELVLPNGARCMDEAAITKHIQSLLPVKEGTFRRVLLAPQSYLSDTVNHLRKCPESAEELGEILRKAVYETDGVSVEKVKRDLLALHTDYFGHWDILEQGPEKGRGPRNPWKQEVGKILAAFYRRENARILMTSAEHFEERLQDIMSTLSRCLQEIEENDGFLKTHKAAFEDSLKRKGLVLKIEVTDREYESLLKYNTQWPIHVQRDRQLQEIIPRKNEELVGLRAQERAVMQEEQNRSLRSQFDKVEARRKACEDAQKQLGQVIKVSREQLKAMREKQALLSTLEARLDAGLFNLDFEARRDLELTVQKGMEPAGTTSLVGGRSTHITARGFLMLDHPDWRIKIYPGGDNSEELITRCSSEKWSLQALFTEAGASSLEETEKNKELYDEKAGAAKQAQQSRQASCWKKSFRVWSILT